MREARPQEALIGALVECFAPSFPPLPAGERTAVVLDVTRTVAQQIAAMPSFLRMPYRSALAAFDLMPLLRWGRTFRRLDADRRHAWVRTWDEHGVGPTRAFVKLVRSCTLFAWFDHPRIGVALATGTDA